MSRTSWAGFCSGAWPSATGAGDAAEQTDDLDEGGRRRLLFSACFLIGPFAESATGFGVGMIGTMVLVRRLGVPTVHLLAFSLLSQAMILWGAMDSGAIIAGALADTSATDVALHSSPYVAVFHLFWLPLFWRLAKQARIPASNRELLAESAWMASGLALTIAATSLPLGPEIATLAAYGPLIVLRHVLGETSGRRALLTAARRALLFVLIGWLVATRLVPPLRDVLLEAGRTAPFGPTTAWSIMEVADVEALDFLTGLVDPGANG